MGESYAAYLSEHEDTVPQTDITLSASDAKTSDGDFMVTENGTLLWESDGGDLTFDIVIEADGLYAVSLRYRALESLSDAVELAVLIDGEIPYSDAQKMILPKVFVPQGEKRFDSMGNEIRRVREQDPDFWQSAYLRAESALSDEPPRFWLSAGRHTVTLRGIRANLELDTLTLGEPENPQNSPAPDSEQLGSGGEVIRIEGEDAVRTSARTLCAASDGGGDVSPSQPGAVRYNTFGGENFNRVGQSVTWQVTPENSGLYRLGVKARQNVRRGMESGRRVLIDGEVPEGFENTRFYYDSDWSLTQIGGGASFYLEGGQTHEITMEVTIGEIGGILSKLEGTLSELNACYREILMVTGPDPDPYNDYYVEESIPTLLDDFTRLSGELKTAREQIEELSESEGSEASALESVRVTLDKCVKKPGQIPRRLSALEDDLSAMAAFLSEARDRPLEIDYLELVPEGEEFSPVRESFWRRLVFAVRAFLRSFKEDPEVLTPIDDPEETLSVWVNLGREQALAVKELTESEFAARHPKTPVSVNLVAGGLVEAALSDNAPDVALFLGGELPVNLAGRGLLTELSALEGFDEEKDRLGESALIPYSYEGGVYGIPLTRAFTTLFYRADVLSGLGIGTLPRTWDELIETLPALQRRHLGVGLILPGMDAAPATEAGHTFATLLLQNHLTYYNADRTATSFEDPTAIRCFELWTKFYSDYRLEQVYSPFSTFRSGEYPLLVADYAFANQLSAAAPEISGLWGFTVMPGLEDENGEICHASNSQGTGAVIFSKNADKQEAAWEYVKWFSSQETQLAFARRLEGLLGRMGRYQAADFAVVEQLGWSKDELEILRAQHDALDEIPILPSSYAVTRDLMNAFRASVNEGENPRDTLLYYTSGMNDEIARKNAQLRGKGGGGG